MSDVLQIASIGLLEGQQRLEVISRNAASASIPGYKREVGSTLSFAAALAADNENMQALPANGVQPTMTRGVDLRAGAMISTERPLDLAIEPDNVFFALTDGVQTWLTRAGSFQIGADGALVGEQGLHVVGVGGDIRLPSADVVVQADGRILHQGQIVGAVQLFQSNNPAALHAARGALLLAPDGMEPADAESARVRSGMLEGSNTDTAREMVGLMALSRQFESLGRVMQSYDEALGRVIQQLGEG